MYLGLEADSQGGCLVVFCMSLLTNGVWGLLLRQQRQHGQCVGALTQSDAGNELNIQHPVGRTGM